jgi:hypothetical protein
MNDLKELLDREAHRVDAKPDALETVLSLRDRKRRNRRIAAGVVGIAVFVAAVWIVTSVGSFDRTQTPAVPGPTETGTQPDVVEQGRCGAGARSRLELTDMGVGGGPIRMRFEVHHSPVGHTWRITLRHSVTFSSPRVFFRGTRVASDNGVLAVTRRFPGEGGPDGIWAKARDTQTGHVCRVYAEI